MTAAVAEASSARWLRVAKIVAVFVVVGPLVASVGLFMGHVIEGASNPRYALSLASAPAVFGGWLAISFMAAGPYALLTGGAFALLAVFAGASQFWVAVATALAPMPVIHLLPPVGDPIWRLDWFFVLTAIGLVAASASACWYLSRRWHGQPQ